MAIIGLGISCQRRIAILLQHILPLCTTLVQMIPPHAGADARHVAVLLRRADVMPGGKMLAFTAQHDDLDLVILDGALERVVQLAQQPVILRVAILRAIEHHPCHAVLDVIGHIFRLRLFAHRNSPQRGAMRMAPSSRTSSPFQ
jgi:hypothetical protein